MKKLKIQHLTFDFQNAGETLAKSLETDSRYNILHKISFTSPSKPQAPATIELASIDDDNSLIEAGVYVGEFQNLFENKALEIDWKIKEKAKLNFSLKDQSSVFTPYVVQVVFYLLAE